MTSVDRYENLIKAEKKHFVKQGLSETDAKEKAKKNIDGYMKTIQDILKKGNY